MIDELEQLAVGLSLLEEPDMEPSAREHPPRGSMRHLALKLALLSALGFVIALAANSLSNLL